MRENLIRITFNYSLFIIVLITACGNDPEEKLQKGIELFKSNKHVAANKMLEDSLIAVTNKDLKLDNIIYNDIII